MVYIIMLCVIFRKHFVVIDGETIRIIDYKTGRKRSGYDEQVLRYKTALTQLYPGKDIEGYLCYVDESAIVIEPVA